MTASYSGSNWIWTVAESSQRAPPRVHRVAITLLRFIRSTHDSSSANSHLISDLWPRQLINKSVTLGTSVFTHSSVKSGAARCKDDCAALSFVSKRWGRCRSVRWLICDGRARMINLYDMECLSSAFPSLCFSFHLRGCLGAEAAPSLPVFVAGPTSVKEKRAAVIHSQGCSCGSESRAAC